MKSYRMRTIGPTLATASIAVSLAACASHREAVRLEQEQISNAEQAFIDCVVSFARTTDAPRLTATELAQGGVAACARKRETIRELALDQGVDRPAVDYLIHGLVDIAQQTALAALAIQDKNK